MIRMIRWFHEETGIEIGYKPAGGIATAKDALDYMALMKEELGTHWLQPHLFRFGASQPADRHRAPARAQPHRPLLGRLPPCRWCESRWRSPSSGATRHLLPRGEGSDETRGPSPSPLVGEGARRADEGRRTTAPEERHEQDRANLRDPRLRPGPRSPEQALAWLDSHGRKFGHFIDGAWTKPGKTFASDNPATGKTLAQVTDGTAADVDAAVKAARAAFTAWVALSRP